MDADNGKKEATNFAADILEYVLKLQKRISELEKERTQLKERIIMLENNQ